MKDKYLYPLLLKPPIKDYLWGGTRLKTDFGYETEKDIAAEAWVLSCHKDGTNTVINNGDVCVKLTEVLEQWGAAALGKMRRNFRTFLYL